MIGIALQKTHEHVQTWRQSYLLVNLRLHLLSLRQLQHSRLLPPLTFHLHGDMRKSQSVRPLRQIDPDHLCLLPQMVRIRFSIWAIKMPSIRKTKVFVDLMDPQQNSAIGPSTLWITWHVCIPLGALLSSGLENAMRTCPSEGFTMKFLDLFPNQQLTYRSNLSNALLTTCLRQCTIGAYNCVAVEPKPIMDWRCGGACIKILQAKEKLLSMQELRSCANTADATNSPNCQVILTGGSNCSTTMARS